MVSHFRWCQCIWHFTMHCHQFGLSTGKMLYNDMHRFVNIADCSNALFYSFLFFLHCFVKVSVISITQKQPYDDQKMFEFENIWYILKHDYIHTYIVWPKPHTADNEDVNNLSHCSSLKTIICLIPYNLPTHPIISSRAHCRQLDSCSVSLIQLTLSFGRRGCMIMMEKR